MCALPWKCWCVVVQGDSTPITRVVCVSVVGECCTKVVFVMVVTDGVAVDSVRWFKGEGNVKEQGKVLIHLV